ncbi:MAG: hypothetical protein R8M46_07140 [Ghiorsea sp.]
MVNKLLLATFFLVFIPNTWGIELPYEVVQFIEKRDSCDHFRGEYPYDKERRVFLYKNMVELCSGTDKELADLKKKHNSNSDVMKALSVYENTIEPKK